MYSSLPLSLSVSLFLSLPSEFIVICVFTIAQAHIAQCLIVHSHTDRHVHERRNSCFFPLRSIPVSLTTIASNRFDRIAHLRSTLCHVCVSVCVCDIAKPVVDRYTQFFKSQQLQLFSYAHVNRIITITVAQPVSSSCASLHDEYILVYATSNAWNWQSVQAS